MDLQQRKRPFDVVIADKQLRGSDSGSGSASHCDCGSPQLPAGIVGAPSSPSFAAAALASPPASESGMSKTRTKTQRKKPEIMQRKKEKKRKEEGTKESEEGKK
mmetsp:Transcript_10944/g.24121  ORF Transcript_10944/g.24121 Transcript_10944/m.24121 type:complete len:104 (-) Transcript_10944:83-394(-)